MNTIRFAIPGRPQPIQRARVFVRKGTNKISSAIPRDSREYESHMRVCAMAAAAIYKWRPGRGPYALLLDVYRRERVGDWDNYGKGADAFKGVLWEDDRYVVDARVRLFVDKVRPRIEVVVAELKNFGEAS